MPASEHEPTRVLSSAQIQQFIQDGFVRIDRAFPQQLADEGRSILWRGLPCDPDDPLTWTRPVIRLGEYDDEPFKGAVNSPVLYAAFDQLVGKGRWRPRKTLGTFPVRFPKDWVLPAAIERVRRKLASADDGNRQVVDILNAVLTDGLPAVEAACAEAIAHGVHSADVVLNILARQRDPAPPANILTPAALTLRHAPIADCARYDNLRRTI